MRMPWRPTGEGRAPWPVILRDASAVPEVVLRPLTLADEKQWQRVRRDNATHVARWEPTLPPGTQARTSVSFRQFVRDLDADARADRALPWCIDVGGQVVGQVHIFGIVRAAQQSAAAGYWLAENMSGHGIATRALALALDHALGDAGLHRIEVNIRLDNDRSLALVRRLGLREEGIRVRYLHIDGAWRDHLSFAVTAEEVSGRSLLSRLSHL